MAVKTAPRTKFVRPDIHLIAVDETGYWNIVPEHQPFIEKILTVSLYDASRHVHCCEMTPSYELWFVRHQVILTPAGEELQEMAPSVFEKILSDYEYHRPDCDVSYMWAHRVDALVETLKKEPFRYKHEGDPFPKMKVKEYRELLEERDGNAFMEGLVEGENCNHSL
jgi:hypothetical protein